jgi:hypothetical protein
MNKCKNNKKENIKKFLPKGLTGSDSHLTCYFPLTWDQIRTSGRKLMLATQIRMAIGKIFREDCLETNQNGEALSESKWSH